MCYILISLLIILPNAKKEPDWPSILATEIAKSSLGWYLLFRFNLGINLRVPLIESLVDIL
jgi:hypothetical protein